MQAIVPPSGRNPNGHTEAEIRAALAGLSGSRRWSFHYTLLTKTNVVRTDALEGVISCRIDQNWAADIKRTMQMKIRDTGAVDWLSDRIQPRVRLHLAPYGIDDWVEWPLGVFMLNSPKRTAESTGQVTRDLTGYDLTQLYADDAPPTRYTVVKGATYMAGIVSLLGVQGKVVTPNTQTATVALSWDPGTTRLRMINDCLGNINYNSLSFDENGLALINPYVVPSKRAIEWTYADDDYGLLVPGGEQTLDLASVPNQIVKIVSDPDRPKLVAKATNTNPGSPLSTVRRGRIITRVDQEQNAPSLLYLQTRAEVELVAASQVYESVEFETGLNPLHSGNDVYRLRYSPLALNSPYAELAWSMELKAGARMKHTARRVVTI